MGKFTLHNIRGGGTYLAEVASGAKGIDSEANARLIAKAPEMLALLVILTDHASEQYPHFESERGQRELAQARALLREIEG